MPDAIVRSVTVAGDPAAAFRLWVERIDAWWPKAHSRSKDPRTTVVLEGRAGGRFFERASDGAEYELGSVVLYEPPSRLVYHWFLGSSAEQPTVVIIRFTAVGADTRVDVEHRGPGEIGALWEQRSVGFARSWVVVLESYVHAGKRMEGHAT